MNIISTQFPVFSPYKKSTWEIYVSGCKRKCEGCHNSELFDFGSGNPFDLRMIDAMKEKMFFFDAISILGGEPLDQDEVEMRVLSKELRKVFPKKELWLFTGYNFSSVPEWIWQYYDYVKVGSYMETLKKEGFPSSSNQKLYKNDRKANIQEEIFNFCF